MRPMTSCRAVLFLLLLLLAVTPLLAQDLCEPTDTIAKCLERYEEGVYVDAMEAEERDAFERQPTGVDIGGADLATTKKDFSPLMALSALLGQSGKADGTGKVVYDLNFLIPGLAKKGAKNGQLEAVVNMEPQISERIRNELHNQNRDAEIEPLKEKLGELADYTIRLTYNHTSDSFGRSFAQHEESYKAMCHTALGMAGWKEKGASLVAKVDFRNLPRDKSLKEMTPAEEMETRQRFAALDRDPETVASVRDVMSAAGLKSYHQLVDNQPQFQVTAEKTHRHPLVGSDDLSLKVTYEWSPKNLNRATAGCAETWKSDKPEERETREMCLQNYMNYVEAQDDEIAKGHRLSVSGEYFDSEGETIPVFGIDPTESARKLVLSLGWGRRLNLGGGEPVQFDLKGSYEDVSDDPNRQDRGIVRLTLTRNVGKMSIPFGIVYANHGEFLDKEGVDARLSAHIGLTFKMRNGNQ